MATLSATFSHPLCTDTNHRAKRQALNRQSVRSMKVMSCQNQKLPEESEGVIHRTVKRMVSEVGKIGNNLKLEKKMKGDVKDLMLMSLSFAVYVYISQQMVCTYFAWQHLSFPNPSW